MLNKISRVSTKPVGQYMQNYEGQTNNVIGRIQPENQTNHGVETKPSRTNCYQSVSVRPVSLVRFLVFALPACAHHME